MGALECWFWKGLQILGGSSDSWRYLNAGSRRGLRLMGALECFLGGSLDS